MPLDIAARYVRSRRDWRCFDGDEGQVWVRWGQSAAAKAEAVLHVRGAPSTPQDIFATMGAGATTLKRCARRCMPIRDSSGPADVSGVARLRRLLGRPVRNPAAAVAASLGCRRAEVAAVLRERGDGNLADLLED